MKKILSLVLMACLVLSCMSFGVAEEKPSTWLCDEKTTLTVCTYDAVNNSFPTISNDLRFWQWLEDYTNVHIEWDTHSVADYDTVVATQLSSGSVATDIINVRNVDVAVQAGMNGTLVDAKPYIDTCWPNIVEYDATVNPTVISGVTAADGGIYCVTGKVSPDIGHILYMYNTEWLEKLGKEVPTTLDEFYDLCVAMKEAGDLNGNGEADEIILTASGMSTLDIMGNSFGLEMYEDWDAFVADEDGTVHDEYTSDEMRNFLTYLNQLYSEGILDPSITNTSADEMSQKIAADNVGIFVYYSAFAITYGRLTTKGQADQYAEVYTLGGPLMGPDGDQYYVYRDKVGGDATGVSATSENIELALKWLDVLTSDPLVIKTRTCGWEGEHYYYDENGEMQLIYPEDGSAWSVSELGCGQIAMPHYQTYDQLMNSRKNIPWYMNEYNAILDMDCFIHPSVPQTQTYTDEEYELIDLSRSDVLAYFKEMRAKFITGEADIATEWDSYVSTMYSLGLQDWIDAEQSISDRT
ncbi:MAG: extracellular solute-binding protein [Clostridia bacterium]|nr:extracellular solute-binding protein [Clostridia bacterium]